MVGGSWVGSLLWGSWDVWPTLGALGVEDLSLVFGEGVPSCIHLVKDVVFQFHVSLTGGGGSCAMEGWVIEGGFFGPDVP